MQGTAPNSPCPCCSGAKYKRCCRPFHKGRLPESPKQLMRARYSAYAQGNVDFIIETTAPLGPQWKSDLTSWRQELADYCQRVQFISLTVTDAPPPTEDDAVQATVSFRADLLGPQGSLSFSETSRFLFVAGKWLYHSGLRD